MSESVYLDFDLENVPELTILPNDSEVIVQIQNAEMKEGISQKTGESFRQLRVRLTVPDEPSVKDIYHSVWLPVPDTDEKRRVELLNGYRNFLVAFGLPMKLTTDQMQGAKAWAVLRVDDSNPDYPAQNLVKRFVGPA